VSAIRRFSLEKLEKEKYYALRSYFWSPHTRHKPL
jgi:hypothetical protein